MLELTAGGPGRPARPHKDRLDHTDGRPAAAPEKTPRAGEIACDEELFERLRRLRKTLADERFVPAYIVFSDVALRQMARYYPASRRGFLAHQRRGREEAGGIRRRLHVRNRRPPAIQPPPDFRRRFLPAPRETDVINNKRLKKFSPIRRSRAKASVF